MSKRVANSKASTKARRQKTRIRFLQKKARARYARETVNPGYNSSPLQQFRANRPTFLARAKAAVKNFLRRKV